MAITPRLHRSENALTRIEPGQTLYEQQLRDEAQHNPLRLRDRSFDGHRSVALALAHLNPEDPRAHAAWAILLEQIQLRFCNLGWRLLHLLQYWEDWREGQLPNCTYTLEEAETCLGTRFNISHLL